MTLTPAALVLDETVTVFAQASGGAATADVILAGLSFDLSGEVTALVTGDGGPTQVTLDGLYVVDVSHALWLSSGGESAQRPHGDSGSLQVGSKVELWGIANAGAFVAAFGKNGSGGSQGGGNGATMENGFILTPITDPTGTVTGFTMTSKGSTATIVLDASTVISGKGSTTAALVAGVHVKVWGSNQADGSVLASTIIIKGGSRH